MTPENYPDRPVIEKESNQASDKLISHYKEKYGSPYFGGELKEGGHNGLQVKSYLADYQRAMGCSELEFVSKRNFTMNKFGKDFNLFQSPICSNGNELIFWDHFKGGHIPRFNNQYFKEIIQAL